MAKKAYIGVNGTARRVKRVYLGAEGTARKVQKAYIGIGGVARPCWSSGEIAYYGTITPLATAAGYGAGGFNGSYALFAGGAINVAPLSCVSRVEAYNTALVRSAAPELSFACKQFSSVLCGGYLLFAGGLEESYATTVDVYSPTLTRSAASSGLTTGRGGVYTAYNDGYGLFCGGYRNGNDYNTVEAYNAHLTRSLPAALSMAVYEGRGTNVGDYALFCGGNSFARGQYPDRTQVDAYDQNLTKRTAAALSAGMSNHSAVHIGDYALIVWMGYANAYDKNLTKTIPASLSVARKGFSGEMVLGEKAMFAGGHNGDAYYDTVDVYDAQLTRTSMVGLSAARNFGTGVAMGDYALYAGGETPSGGFSAAVDVYTI